VNTVKDLRAMLDARSDITDDEIGARSWSIARRVRVVRRRRTAGVGLAAAVIVAGTAVVASLSGGSPQPSPAHQLLGVDVPPTMTANGYTYQYAGSATSAAGSDVATVTVAPGDSPVVVSWATQGTDQSVRVHSSWEHFTSTEADFTDYVLISDAMPSTTIKVTGTGATALAVYHLASTPPAGVTTDGITYRRDVAGKQLLDARIAPQGANRLAFDLTAPLHPSQLSFAELCRATGTMSDHQAWLRLSINGHGWFGTSCMGDASLFDPGASGGTSPWLTYHPGQHLHITMTLLDRPHGHLSQDANARIAMGAYAVTETPRHFAGGLTLASIVEYDGHTWALAKVASGIARKGRPVTMTAPASRERVLVGFSGVGLTRRTNTRVLVDGRPNSDLMTVGPTGISGSLGGLIDAGHHTVGAAVEGADARVALGLYELVD
jgi:hypothetical protein